MASGESVKGSRSVTRGSDDVISHECDSCKYDGSRSEGIVFCETCDEYMCGTCVSVHKKNKATRGHNIVEGQDILKTSKLVGSDSDEDYCDVHKDKEIKFYCEAHDLVLCDVCKSIDHIHDRIVLKDKKAMKIGEFSVRELSDTEPCYIIGAQFLEDGRLVVIDCQNKKVKILDSKLTVQSSVTVQSHPCGIALINQQEAVTCMTLSRIYKLQFLRLSPRLELIRQVNARLECKGVVCHNSKLYVSCVDKDILVVLVLNLLGQEETVIRTDVKGGLPSCIAADTRGNLYISDRWTDMVVCITLKGDVVYKYTHNTLQYPTALLLDTDNNVLVCGTQSYNVQVISHTGTYHRDIIPPMEGGVERPVSLAYRRSDNTLVVGMIGNDMMLSF